MKRLIALLFLTLPMLLSAQEKKDTLKNVKETEKIQVQSPPVLEHLRFKSIELNGPKEIFLKNLEKAGFEYEGDFLKGPFAGYNVTLGLMTTPLSKTVYGVKIYFPQRSTVQSAQEDYKLIKNNLCSVYGKPVFCQEKYLQPYREGDGYSMKALQEGKAIFQTIWETGIGKISCEIIYSASKAKLILSYCDAINEDKMTKEKNIQIQQDL